MTKPVKELTPDPVEIKKLSVQFTEIFRSFFKPAEGNREEIARQMLTTLSALTLTIEVIKEHAGKLGMNMHVEILTPEEMAKQMPTVGGKH